MSILTLSNNTPFYLKVDKSDFSTHQIIYASELYGTFFSVAAKLLENPDKKGELSSMELYLVNYKGILNIGMLELTKTSFVIDKKGAILTLHLGALQNGTHGPGNSITVDCKNIPISSLKSMVVTRELHSFMNHQDPKNHLNDDVFDEEFFERDGVVIIKRDRLDDKISTAMGATTVCRDTSVKFV